MLLMCVIVNNCTITGESPTPFSNDLAEATASLTHATLPKTPIPTQSQTMTIVPALPPAEAEAKVLELLRNNGECRLPCFWGFVPNQDDGEFLTFLMKIGNEDGRLILARNDVFLEIQIALAGNSNAIYTKAYHNIANRIEKIYSSSYYSEPFQYYSLSSLLTAYGLPEQVYVVLDTGIADMGLGVDLYLLSIEYPTNGWMAVFEMPLREEGGKFLGCPWESFVNLRVWSAGNDPSDPFIGGLGGDDKSYLFTIEEASSMTLEEFYQKFKDPSTACLETPADIHK